MKLAIFQELVFLRASLTVAPEQDILFHWNTDWITMIGERQMYSKKSNIYSRKLTIQMQVCKLTSDEVKDITRWIIKTETSTNDWCRSFRDSRGPQTYVWVASDSEEVENMFDDEERGLGEEDEDDSCESWIVDSWTITLSSVLRRTLLIFDEDDKSWVIAGRTSLPRVATG